MFVRPVAAVSALALACAAFSGTASAASGVHLVGHLSTLTRGQGDHKLVATRTALTGITGLPDRVESRIVADLNNRTAHWYDVPEAGQVGPFELEDKLSLAHADARYVTVKQKTYWYAGGAHGESAIVPVTYSATTGKLLTVKSFAAKGKLAALLKVLSVSSRRSLAARGITADFYDLGTTPTLANFGLFQPLPAGWRVEFPQGDVADEAHGPLAVLVPWSALKGLLRLPRPTA